MSTTTDLINYYKGLLIMQYATQPKALATIETVVTPAIFDSLALLIQGAYDIETAVGVQLDVLGKYAGVSRYGYDFNGPATLNDDDFRVYMKMAILQNNSTSSLSEIQNLIAIYFPTSLRVFDFANMQMQYMFDSSAGSQQLAQFFVKQGLLPRPIGVQLGALIYSPNINSFFGGRTYSIAEYNNSPFNTYDNYITGRPWLSYENAIFE